MARILVVDDEANIVELIKFSLEKNEHQVLTAYDGKMAKHIIDSTPVDLILLDLMLPGMDGLELCKYVRGSKRHSQIPIIMITARNHEKDKLDGFEYGVDDYVTKPFSIKELGQRVKAVLRRSIDVEKFKAKIEIHDLEIDLENYILLRNNRKIELTLKEFEVIKLLIQNRGKVVSRGSLLNQIWGYDYFGETRTVDVHIRHLRKKLEDEDNKIIETVRGVGYKIN